MNVRRVEKLLDSGLIRQALERSCNTMDDADDIVDLMALGVEVAKAVGKDAVEDALDEFNKLKRAAKVVRDLERK
jgi:hypothetical protein